eukprot:scaffold177683_cov66-Cyclotella_meneghiniana.AAC.3
MGQDSGTRYTSNFKCGSTGIRFWYPDIRDYISKDKIFGERMDTQSAGDARPFPNASMDRTYLETPETTSI